MDTTKLGAVGYCLGGTGIVELARAYPNGTDGLSGKSSSIGTRNACVHLL